MQGLVKKIVAPFTLCLRVALAVNITLIAVLAMAQVVYRYILHWPGHYLDELLVLCSVWLYFLGSLNASIEEKHINARMLEIFFTKIRAIAGIRLVGAVVSIATAGWLSYWAYDFLLYSLKKGKISVVLKFPLSFYEAAAFICFVPMTLFACLEAWKYLNMAIRNDTMGEEL